MTTNEEIETDEEFFIASANLNELDKERVIDLLKDFSSCFTHTIEQTFEFFLSILNEETLPKKSNSNTVTALGSAANAIPWIGKAISSGLKEAEIYFLKKIDKGNAVTLAHLVYYYHRNKEQIRTILIETAMEIFYCYEHQFLRLNCNGGPSRAMLKLARDAAHRIFTFFLDNKEIKNISKQNLAEGVIKGDPLLKILNNSERSVQAGKDNWKTSDIYREVGLFVEANEDKYFTRQCRTNTKKYGHRRLFSWENEDILAAQNWSRDVAPSPRPFYFLKKEDLSDLYTSVEDYIMKENPEEEAKLDRKQKHKEVMEDRSSKHEEIKKLLLSKEEVFIELSKIYLGIQIAQEINNNVLTTIEGKQVIDSERHKELCERLTALQLDQYQVLQTNQEIKREIIDIKMSSQYETSSTTENQITVNAAIENNVTIKQYYECNHEEPKTLPQELNEAFTNIPTPQQVVETLIKISENVRDEVDAINERNHQNTLKFLEIVKKDTEISAIENNVTIKQYYECNHEEPQTLPQKLNEAFTNIPTPQQVVETLNKISKNVRDEVGAINECNHQNTVKFFEIVKKDTEIFQKNVNEIIVKSNEKSKAAL